MTVAELISRLQRCDQQAVVRLHDWGEDYHEPREMYESEVTELPGEVVLGGTEKEIQSVRLKPI